MLLHVVEKSFREAVCPDEHDIWWYSFGVARDDLEVPDTRVQRSRPRQLQPQHASLALRLPHRRR